MPLTSLRDSHIVSVGRRGKLILVNLREGEPEHLIFHLRMTGRLFTSGRDKPPNSHTRCVFGLREPDGLEKNLFFDDMRTFGKIMVANKKVLRSWKFWSELGPEPLEIDSAEFSHRLKGVRPIKNALLDQRVIAGIGNIYADEALFRAGVHPLTSAGELAFEAKARLLEALKNVLSESISQCGSSIRDYLDADGNPGAFQNSFAVYGRGNMPCKKCGTILQKLRLGGRSTVFCPNCQK